MNEGRGAHWSRCGGSRESIKCVDIGELLKWYIIKNVGVRIVSTITTVFHFLDNSHRSLAYFGWLLSGLVWLKCGYVWFCMVYGVWCSGFGFERRNDQEHWAATIKATWRAIHIGECHKQGRVLAADCNKSAHLLAQKFGQTYHAKWTFCNLDKYIWLFWQMYFATYFDCWLQQVWIFGQGCPKMSHALLYIAYLLNGTLCISNKIEPKRR